MCQWLLTVRLRVIHACNTGTVRYSLWHYLQHFEYLRQLFQAIKKKSNPIYCTFAVVFDYTYSYHAHNFTATEQRSNAQG